MPSTSTDRIDGLTTSVAIKAPCDAVAVTNITLSGEQTVGSIAVVAGDRVLVASQSTASDNGIWVCRTTAWTRAKDFNGARDAVRGTLVLVKPGTSDTQIWQLDTDSPVIGTSSLSFTKLNIEQLALTAFDPTLTYVAGTFGWFCKDSAINVRMPIIGVSDGAVGDFDTGTLTGTDDTDAFNDIQAYATSVGKRMYIPPVGPGKAYLLTDTWLAPNQSMASGEHGHMGFRGGTVIYFRPTSQKDFWAPTGLPTTLKDGYLLENLMVIGNSASATGNSDIGLDIDNIIKSTFRNIRIQGFRTGIRCYATNSNQLFSMHPTDNYVQSVLYDGGLSTTDCWWGGYVSNAPTLVQTTGATSSIRWIGVTFEGAGTYSALSTTKATGINLVKETEGWMFSQCYGEDAPNTNNADNAMIRVGEDGTTLPGATQVTIDGGKWGGRNAGGTGSFLHVDYTDGVVFGGGAHVARFTNVVRTTANTSATQVLLTGFTCGSVSNIVTDDTKVTGFYPLTSFNGSSFNNQTHRFAGDNYNAPDAACTGAITTTTNWKLTKNGGSVTLTLPNVVGTAAVGQAFWEYAEVIPSKYRPSAALAFGCCIRDNNTNIAQPGMIIISAAGVIRVYRDGVGTTNFTSGFEAGFGQSCGTEVSWTV